MERLYYVESEHETAETSDRFEAARIAAEWVKRGYNVDEIAVDVTDESVQVVDAPKDGAGPLGPSPQPAERPPFASQ